MIMHYVLEYTWYYNSPSFRRKHDISTKFNCFKSIKKNIGKKKQNITGTCICDISDGKKNYK